MSFFEESKKFIDFDALSYLVGKLRSENQSTYMNSSNSVSNEDIDSIFVKPLKNYLTIEALEDGLTVSLSANACEYCIDEDYNWVSLAAGTPSPSLNTGQTISFRGNLTPEPYMGIGSFTISKKCNVLGNVMSMLFGDDAQNNFSLSGTEYSFCELFYDCSNIISAKDLYLPATELNVGCYVSMFSGCTSLTTAPELPATTLADMCYTNMFHGCTSLTTIPELPATILAESCYSSMFSDCTSLVTAPELPATILAESCYDQMFYNCTSLETAPELPATELAQQCYRDMFNGCKLLNHIKMLAIDISASNCLTRWVQNVASTGTFIKHPDMTSLPTGINGIPEGWTVQDAA